MYVDIDGIDTTGTCRQRIQGIIRRRPTRADQPQVALGLPALFLGMWVSSLGLDKSDRRFPSCRTRLQQLLQRSLRSLYTHQVTSTYNAEHRQAALDLDDYIIEHWDSCVIPAAITSHHPSHEDRDVLLHSSFNVKVLWRDLHNSFLNHPALLSTNPNVPNLPA